jgi:ABC-2 type transport system permease protein
MTTATATATTQRVTPIRVVLSEWIKLRTLRSTLFSLLAAIAFVIGFSILVPAVIAAHWPPRDPRDVASFDPVGVSLVGGFFAQLAIGVLGVLLITGEYATGMIRATLAAVPARLPVLWSKALVYALTILVLMIPTCLVAFFIGQSILSSKHIETTFGQAGVARAVFGTALYLAGIGLLGLGLGALIRNTAGAISTLFGLLFVVPIVVHFLPASWSDAIGKYLPGNAGSGIYSLHPDSTQLGPWTGYAVFLLYGVVALVLAAVGLVRRDA